MSKDSHEIRDPLHAFIRLNSDERKVLDSRPVQRLRHIHQLALSYLIYPGATHRRFEHSLGVMELAERVYNVVTKNIHKDAKDFIPQRHDEVDYWRKVLRMAALCHDLGHLPFSHAAETELLPAGWNHERLTGELIRSRELRKIWETMRPSPKCEDILKLAIGPEKYRESFGGDLDIWETILSEIIVGDAFGVDRMDYLLRDSYHAGVAYGHFDHFRLIDTMRILPKSYDGESWEPALGVEERGLHSAEALLLARYFMYSQVYFHPVRRIYNIHLQDFLIKWLPGGRFSTDLEEHLKMTDNEVTAAFMEAARDPSNKCCQEAARLARRDHFHLLPKGNPGDRSKNREASDKVFQAICAKFGAENVRKDFYRSKGEIPTFPVLGDDELIVSSVSASDTLTKLPVSVVDFIFVSKEILKEARSYLAANRDAIISEEG